MWRLEQRGLGLVGWAEDRTSRELGNGPCPGPLPSAPSPPSWPPGWGSWSHPQKPTHLLFRKVASALQGSWMSWESPFIEISSVPAPAHAGPGAGPDPSSSGCPWVGWLKKGALPCPDPLWGSEAGGSIRGAEGLAKIWRLFNWPQTSRVFEVVIT